MSDDSKLGAIHGFLITVAYNGTIMTGIIRFHSLAEAIRQGYEIHDKTRTGYLLRIMTAKGWALALCDLVEYACADPTKRT